MNVTFADTGLTYDRIEGTLQVYNMLSINGIWRDIQTLILDM